MSKVAVVTGGASGIGRAVVDELLSLQNKVIIIDFNQKLGDEVVTDLIKQGTPEDHIHFFHCDVTKVDEFREVFKEAVEKFGGLDILVNNAGAVSEGDWQIMVDVNFNAAIRCTYLGMHYMSKNNGGRGGVIINTVSMAGVKVEIAPVYTATKHGMAAFTESFAKIPGFMEKHGIRVVGVCPGCVTTPIWTPVLQGRAFESSNPKSDDFVGLLDLRAAAMKSVADVMQGSGGFFTAEKLAKVYGKIVKSEDFHGKLICLPQGYDNFVVFERGITFSPLQ